MRPTVTICLLLAVTAGCWAGAPASSPSLAGRSVILVVTPHRSDELAQHLESLLGGYRDQLGLDRSELPIVLMGFQDSDTEAAFFQRLGFHADDAPVVCLAQWGDPARFGPKKVIGDSIVRRATGIKAERAAVLMLRDWLDINGHSDLVPQLEQLSGGIPGAGRLIIVDTAFEANGAPLYLANARVRLRNTGVAALPAGARIRYFAKPKGHTRWILLGTQELGRVPGGDQMVRDLMVDTRKFDLLDKDRGILPCHYRVEVTWQGHTISRQGYFVPQKEGG